jgi:signal transduction histidine kinase
MDSADSLTKINEKEKMGMDALKKGKYSLSEVFFKEALKNYHEKKDIQGEIRCGLVLVQSFIKLREFEKAGLHLDLIHYYLKTVPKSPLLFQYYNEQINLAQARGDYPMAFYWSQGLNKAKDSVFMGKGGPYINPNPDQIRSYTKEKQMKANENLILENREKYTLLIGILLVTLLGVGLIFLYSLYRAKRNAFEITEQANILIHQKNEELERLNQLKNKLFSIIAHDVRSPLNNLAGVLSLIGQGVLEHEEVQQITGKLTNNVKETTNFLDNLLIWSRSQMNGIRIHLQELDMHRLAEETVEVFRFPCEAKKLTLINAVGNNIFVYADREMIRMVLRNLVSNAIKFSVPGGMIQINGTAKAEDDFVIISVSDDGIGVKKEFQDKLFGFDNYTTVGTMDEKGSGIGLMLCRDFVERNGGKIWMESTQNKGSHFFFSLPQYHMAKREEGIKNLLADIL